jgi:chitinase
LINLVDVAFASKNAIIPTGEPTTGKAAAFRGTTGRLNRQEEDGVHIVLALILGFAASNKASCWR